MRCDDGKEVEELNKDQGQLDQGAVFEPNQGKKVIAEKRQPKYGSSTP